MTQALNLANFANKLNTSGATSNAGLQNSAVTITAGTAMSGGGAVSLGGSVTLNNNGVTSIVAGTGISISGATGAVTVTNSSPASSNVIAKAWCNLNGLSGASPVIRGSYNINSVTRTANGTYTVVFATALANVNYSVVGACTGDIVNAFSRIFTPFFNGSGVQTPTTSSFIFSTYQGNGTIQDAEYINFAVFGS